MSSSCLNSLVLTIELGLYCFCEVCHHNLNLRINGVAHHSEIALHLRKLASHFLLPAGSEDWRHVFQAAYREHVRRLNP